MSASPRHALRRRVLPAFALLGALLWGLVELVALQKASWRRII
jgi:hypothetical protein